MQAGLNLFSLRKQIATEQQYEETTKRLKEGGYAYVQYSGRPFEPDVIGRIARQYDMPVHLTHAPLERILTDTDKLMEEHASFGCKNIGLGMLPAELYFDEKGAKKKADEAEKAAEHMSDNGFTFFWHNHHFELFRYADGTTLFDHLIACCPHVHFTVDTYWLQYGGVSVTDFFGKVQGRMECVHLKDYKVTRDGKNMKPNFAPVGAGNMDFVGIVQKAVACGAEYFFVEQDDATDYDDPFGQVLQSIKYINEVL